MSNESLTCSNSSFIVDLPILTPSSSTLLVVETHTGGGVEIGKVSLPEALLRSGIPLTGTQIDTWVQSNSCNVAAATAWFLVNNVKTSRNNTWVANTSSYILSATNWVANNSARLNNLDFTIDGLTDNAIQAGTWFTENSTNLQSLSSDILSLSSDGASLQAFASWIVSNSSTLNNTVTSLTSLLVEEALEETFHNWVISNSSVFGTMLTTLRDLTGDESFIRNASQWVSSVSADVDQTVSWFKVLTSVRELHEVIEMSVFAWVTGNSAEISDILEKNSNGFLSWVSANSAEYQTVYNWYVDNEQSIQNSITWSQQASSRVDILEGSIAIALETAIDANTWISNNADTYASIESVADLATWITDNSSTLSDIQEWYGTLPATATAVQNAIEWIATNGDNVIEAAQWLETLTNSQLLNDVREDQVLTWVEDNSASLNTELTDPNATIALTWATGNSATILQAVNWIHLLTSTQEAYELNVEQVVSWVESTSDRVAETSNWVETASTTLDTLDLITPFIQSFKDSAEWYTVSGELINSAAAWVKSVTSSWVSQIHLDAVQSIFTPTKTWVAQNSSTFTGVANFTTSISAELNNTINWVEETSAVLLESITWIEDVSASVAQIDELVDTVNTFDNTNTWVQSNSSDLLAQSNADISLFDNVATYVTETSVAINAALDDVSLLNSTYEDFGTELTQLQLSVTSTAVSAVSALKWVRENQEAFSTITETANNLTSVINTLTPTTNWASGVSAGLAEITTWVRNNSSLAEVNNVLDNATTWVTQNSSEVERAVNWVSILTSTQQLHDNREEDVFAWVEGNSGALVDVDNTNLDWLNQNKNDIDTNITWVVDNSSKVQESHLATRAYNAQISNLTTWLTGNSAQLKDAAQWVNATSADIDVDTIQVAVNWVATNSSELPLRVEVLETAIDGLPEIQQWYSETDTQLLTDTANWVSTASGGVSALGTKVLTLSTLINTLSSVIDNSVSDVENITAWVSDNSTTITQTTEWVQMLTSTQQLYDEREDAVFTWVETHSGDNTLVDENLIAWVQNNSSELVDVKDWYNGKTFDDNKVSEAITWYQENSAKATEAVEWIEMLTVAQNVDDAEEEQVITWVQSNSGSIAEGTDSQSDTWVRENSNNIENVTDWFNSTILDVDQVNAATTIVSETSALSLKTAQWVQALSSAQNLHDVEEDQVFAWVQSNSGNISEGTDSQSDTWVRVNSGSLEDVVNWNGFEDLNIDKINEVSTIVSETSALAEKTAQWVQALSSAQNLHDVEEDQVFAWVQENSSNVQDVSDSTDAITWVQSNSNTVEDIASWSGFEDLNVNQVNETITWYQENSAKATEAVQWIEMLTEAQNVDDAEEEQVITWVQSNSGSILSITDTQPNTWVRENSNTIEDVVTWSGFEVLNVDQVHAATTIVSETSALAEKTAQWVQALSSAQNLHDAEEDQVFAWVQDNSGNISEGTDSQSDTWVRENSGDLIDVKDWFSSKSFDDNKVNETITWYQENSAKATEAIQWIEILSEAQNIDDAEEEQVITWVQTNSSSIQNTEDSIEAVTWVQSNSNTIEDITNWNGFEDLNVDRVNEVSTIVSETSALAEKTAQWVQALSSAQNLHDAEEDQVFAWVQTNSSNVQDVSDSTDAVTWVQSNSNTIEDVTNWNGFEDLNVDQVNETITWYQENSAKATEAIQWIEMLTEAQNVDDAEEEQVITWVQENSSSIQDASNNVNVDTWVQVNSSDIENVTEWFNTTILDIDQVNAATTIVSETSALALKTAQWVQTLSSAQNIHNLEEDQVFAWVQDNSGNEQAVLTSADVNTWVQSNSNTVDDIASWSGFEDLNVDKVNAATTIVSETSALAEKTAQWVQALSSAQNLHDLEEDQVFAWVQDNSSNISEGASSQSDTWVQANSNTIEDVVNWNGFEDLNVDQINAATTWYQENSTRATEAVEWIEMLTVAQNVDDAEEEQVITWVQSNSGSIAEGTDSQSDTWVRENSNNIENVVNWNGFEDLNVDKVNAATTIVSETSALAEKTAQWVQALSSAQNLHDVEEDQIFAWVQTNSSNVQDVSDSTDAVTWVQANSNTVENIANWSGFEDLNVNQVNETITWYQENSAKASEAVQWIEMLTEAQNVDDAEEEQVITWVQSNSGSISEGTDSQSDTWVRENSNNIEDVVNWNGFEDLNVDQINAATTIVSETSALAEKTAQWVQALSSAQNLHNVEEDQVFAWVQDNSGNEQAVLTSADVNTWVQGNSSKLSAVEAWYDENHPDTATLNSAVDWYSTYGAKAVQATEWVDMLAEANNLHDTREESVLAWVEAHSGDITEGNNLDANLVTWVQDHSTSLNNLEEEWNIFTDLDIDRVNAVTTIVSETSALAAKTAQWVQALSSAQNLHDVEEGQVFAWVQTNSSNVQDVSDSADAVTWVQSNSNTIEDVVNWSGFEDLNVVQVNETITWYQENSARSIETSQWVEMLAEANNLNDARETAVFAWVEANSGNISIPIDSQSDTWVEANSGALADVKDWFVQGLDSINDAVTLVNETSALAARTSQWVQVLSSAQNLHEGEESQVFAWVQSNSDNIQDVSDSTDAVTWVQENSNTLYSIDQWSNSNVVTDSIEWVNTNNANVDNAVTWFQENSTQASEAVQWIEMLSEAQNIHDEREESVITWVEENSGNLTGADTTANVWVQTNSSDVEDVLNWDGFTELNADRINPAVVWVNETSALATKAAEWVQILSSALDNHDVREEQVLTWVETSSGINMSNTVVNTWVQGHSSKLIQVEAWYDENHPETGDLNNVVDWYGTYGARAAEATEWVEMLAEAQNNHEPRETAVFTWVEANSGNVDDVAQGVNTWVKENSSAVDTVVEFVESKHDALTSLENWYTTRVVDEVATASAVSWVQHFSARTAAASLWIETISSIEEGHEQFETQIHTWVSENSGLKTKVGSLNAWVTGTSGFTQQVDNWVALNSSVIGSFVVWWQYLVNLDNQGHIELEEQVHTWVTLNSARYDATDTWVRDHSSGLIQAETWVECTTAFFRSLSSWAVSSSANYDATYTWVSGTSARVLSAVIWVEQYKEPLEGLYNFYHEKEDIITDIIFWYNTRHVIDDDAGDFVQEHKDAILDNIIWVNEHRVEIENTITWANTSSAKYERAYTWVRDHSTQVQEDHNILIDLQEEVANLYQWVYVYPGPWLINAATTVSANSGNGGVDWSIDTVGQGGGSDCECVWDKVEPITNPLGMLTYNEVLTGKTLKWILEQILYTQDLRITINPSSSTVCPDTTVTFYVSAGPEGPVQYAWYKNDVYIGGSGGTTTNGNVYSIQSAGLSDVGEYYAIATYGTKSLTSLHATVSLKELLTFTEHPIDTTLNTGQTLRLSAEIEGTAPINFVWLKNGLPIAGATNTQYYTRINAATGDSGTYKVSASNACGSAISQEAIVNVYAPVVITLNPVTLTTVNSNSPVTLNAAATGSLPITYKWLSGSNAQSITDEIVGVSTPTYTAQNSGVYVMVACNMVNCATSTPATIAYNIPPSVTILPSITSVRTGTSLTISAIEITGSPTPTLQWYKNNILIGNATSSKYDINSIQTGDEAIYTLSASNIAGTASDTSVVYVWSLQIARDPIGTAINPGATWTMYSSAIGTAPIVYYWAKDGVKITDTDRTSYEASQGGTYVLVASNAFGVLSSDPAIITVNIAPMISLVPETTSVLTNTQLKFDGTLIQGTETVTYKWLKDDVVIPGITTIDYTKSGLTVGDSGTYTLCATNMVGSASAQSILVVNEGLQWKTHPLSATINQGSSHTMTVSAYGTEPITYSWLSGSNTGNITTVISPAAENNRSLTTTASGYYRSIASNLVGSITSNSAQVLFNIAPRITLTPASTSVLTNTQLKFDGTLIEGTPTITYKWLKNGVEIVGAPNSEDYTKTGLLTADSGTYMLCATNMVGSATAESILVVNQALSIVRDPIGTAINPGATWVMYSSAFGTEPIVYYWARNGVRITDTNYTSYEASQAGTYVLVASNLVGTVSSTPAIITVNIAPMISLVPETTSVLTNTQLKFDGTLIQGTETVTYKWLKDDVVIPGITTIDYTKSGLTVGDSGTYTLCATNMVGSASAQSILVVNQALGWITQPAGSAINPGQSYTMFASASGTEPITYRWLSGSNTSNITTQIGTNPTFATTASGYYKVVANNTVVGSITSTNALVTFNTLQISLNPVSQTIETGATVTFTASAIGTPTITYKWHFNGNVITNATGTTLTLTNVQAVSAGSYVLEASNIVGSVSSTIATLTVNAAPTTPTMYWGKFAATTNAGGYFTSLAPGTPLGLSANSPVLTNINNYYVLTANDPNYPQGKYASGLIAANSYTNFSALGRVISADYFDKAFMCNTLSSREILLFQQEDSITFPQSFATSYSAYEIATGLNVSTLFENITLNADMWVFTPANTPGTKWARAYDVGSQANQTFSVPGCACNFLINGSIVPYYAFKLGTASTSKTYNLLMS